MTPNESGTDRPQEGETVTLTDEQKQHAQAALRAVQEGVATTPQDLLNEWKAAPEWRELRNISDHGRDSDDFIEDTQKWVPVSNIIGISSDIVSEFMKGRMTSALQLLLEEEFQPWYPHDQPYLMEVCGDFYVDSDGSHRSMACKLVGIKEIYANVSVADVNESEYRTWVEHRDRGQHRDPISDSDSEPSGTAARDRG